jgi:cell wall-associated NlpC family hydrolase
MPRARSLVLVLMLGAIAASPARGATTPTPQRVVTYAKRFLGVPYRFGAVGPRSFDCSGFTQYVFRHFHQRLPRTAQAQKAVGRRVRGRLEAGDLLFWAHGHHVGIYVGRGDFISATVHRGIAIYPLRIWRQTQSFDLARRIAFPSAATPSAGTALKP